MFEFPSGVLCLGVSSPKRGHGVYRKKESLPRWRWCVPRLRGLPRRGSVRLGKPENRKREIMVRLGEAFARPGEGKLHLGEGRLRLGEPVTV